MLLKPRQGLIRHLAPPPPEFRERNLACVKCTLARRSELITSDVQVDRSHSERCLEQDQDICCAPLTKFLAMWNGDWSSPVVEHWCPGPWCCSDDDACQENMVAALIEVDLLLSHESEPSVNDWGSMGSAIGKIACGLLVHDILPRVFHHALPSWSSMGPAENDHAADNIQAYRIRIQKKSWRASKALSEPHRRKKMLLLRWVAWPVERLQSEFEWLDNH